MPHHAPPVNPSPVSANAALVNAALGYAARGWHVFPLRPGDKRPAFPDHSEDHCTGRDPRCRRAGRHITWEQRATTDPARIRAAWTRTPYGIGIATGPSGLIVIDLDVPKPDADPLPPEWARPGIVDGTDTWCLLAERSGHPVPLDTYTASTPRGGLHLYFTAPGGVPVRTTASTLAPLVDTRAHGGYVAAPPSVLRPARDHPGGAYRLDDDTPPAPLPAWLAERLTPRQRPATGPVTVTLTTGSQLADTRRTAYLTAAVRRQLDVVTTATEGTRNRALYISATALGQLVAGGCLDSDDARGWLTDAATTAGLTAGEITRTITSGMRAGAKRPRSLDVPCTTDGQGRVAA
ncbi:MAG: hypothetical protein QG597_4728 [Actinomycetota bacterium]|nr:hypothetical protein [Actinomycetota bacterium]